MHVHTSLYGHMGLWSKFSPIKPQHYGKTKCRPSLKTLLRRQCAVACWRLVTIQEYEPVPSVTNCKRARAQLSLSAGKNPLSATHTQHPIHPAKQPSILLSAAHHLAFSCQSSSSQQPLIWPSSTNNQAFNSRPANSDQSANSGQAS